MNPDPDPTHQPWSELTDARKDPSAGQVIEPDGSSPEDPAARSLYRACLTTLIGIGIIVGISIVIYRVWIAV